MLDRIAQHWWILLLRGIVALALGIVAIFFVGSTALALAVLFGVYALVDGVIAIVASVRMDHADHRWGWLLVEGLIGVVAGVLALIYPLAALLALAFLMGAWAILSGVAAITTAWRLRRVIAGEWLWILIGVFSVAFGIIVFLQPAAGVLALVYAFSFYAILTGVTFIGLAMRLRNLRGGSVAPSH